MTELEHLIDTATSMEGRANGESFLSVLNVIAQLMRESNQRPSKAIYKRKFNMGKLVVDISYDGNN